MLKSCQAGNQQEENCLLASLISDLVDGGSMLLRNVGKLPPGYNIPEDSIFPNQHLQNIKFCVLRSPCLFVQAVGPEDVGQFSMDK
jgi:hypothetical protein